MSQNTPSSLPKDKVRNTFILFAVLCVVFIGALISGPVPSSRWAIFRDGILFYPLFLILLGYSAFSCVKWFKRFQSIQ